MLSVVLLSVVAPLYFPFRSYLKAYRETLFIATIDIYTNYVLSPYQRAPGIAHSFANKIVYRTGHLFLLVLLKRWVASKR